ncbi:MAG: methyltransferase domain-containing protein [Actinomycetota bacterium]|nr:methyltransferase domain-containing protein [Actinomycetota bacterium]
MRFDEAASRRLLASYRTPDIVRQRELVLEALAPGPGERVLDIGSGPGLLAHELAHAVGPEGSVAGIDLSENMLALARELEPGPGQAAITLAVADAGELPFPPASFDAVLSTQVYEYVPDMPRALAEARRVLRPGGRILILDTDWDSLVWHATDEDLRGRILSAWDEHLADPYLPRKLPRLLRDADFSLRKCAAIPLLNYGYDRNTFSANLIEMVASFVPQHQGVTEADASAWAEDLKSLGQDYFFSLNRYLFVAGRP